AETLYSPSDVWMTDTVPSPLSTDAPLSPCWAPWITIPSPVAGFVHTVLNSPELRSAPSGRIISIPLVLKSYVRSSPQMLKDPAELAFTEMTVGVPAMPAAGTTSASASAASPAIVSALAFMSVSPLGSVVVLAGAGAVRLPAGDELEPLRMDCLR